jgi:hypothetical protein
MVNGTTRGADMRAGKEPAEDVMRRIIMACEEAGLIVHQRRTYFHHRDDGDFRFLLVSASPPGVPRQAKPPDLCFTAVEIEAIVGVDGRCEGVGIKSTTQNLQLTPEGDLIDPLCKDNATMNGRTGVALSDLTAELMDVANERCLVQNALAKGEQGPWEFAKSRWKRGPIM